MPAARADDPGRKPRGNCHHTKRRTRNRPDDRTVTTTFTLHVFKTAPE